MTHVIPSRRWLAGLALAALAGCGGGGEAAPEPAAAAGATQGFWSGTLDAGTTAFAVFLAQGPAMIVLQSDATTSLVVAQARVSGSAFTIEGRLHDLTAGGSSAFLRRGTVLPGRTLALAAAGRLPAATLAYDAGYERPVQPADVAGRWSAGFSGNTLTLALAVSGDGQVSGSNSSGCRYTGSIAPHPGGVAVFDVQLDESCTGVPAVRFNGIATHDARRSVLSVALVSEDRATATLFQARR